MKYIDDTSQREGVKAIIWKRLPIIQDTVTTIPNHSMARLGVHISVVFIELHAGKGLKISSRNTDLRVLATFADLLRSLLPISSVPAGRATSLASGLHIGLKSPACVL